MNLGSEMAKAERIRAIRATAAIIAHELRTPLLGIKSGVSGVGRYMPILLDAYQQARASGIKVEPIRLAHLEALEGALERVDAEVDYSNTIIDILLLNASPEGMPTEKYSTCSMRKCVLNALDRYPFASEEEKALVNWRDGDFSFFGKDLLMEHVIFNLLKNALFQIARAGKGEISIAVETSNKENRLIFRDTGHGISADVLPHIFKRFYSGQESGEAGNDKSTASGTGATTGTGIGLTFCKAVLESFGGAIACRSKLGEYTEFVMTFPAKP